ncbi:MAG: pilus assembly protein TadG-related protein [Anaerolineales bacterium]
MNFRNTERGQALIIIVFSIVGLIGITALAVDGGNAYLDRRQAQNAADTAALASAFTRIRGGQNWVTKALEMAETNGYPNDGVRSTVEVFSPPISGPYAGNIEYIQVVITSHVPTYFGGVIGQNTLTNRVEAVSRTKSSEFTEILKGHALISLAPTSDCQNNKAFWVHGEATLNLIGGGVFVNSNNPDCALLEQGSGSLIVNGNHPINVVGGASIQKPHLVVPYPPNTGAPAVSYPPPFLPPKVSCGKAAEISADGTTLSPGYWGDDFPPKDVTHLESGNYCVDDFIMNGGSLSGSRVTIKVDGEIRWNGNASIDLTAPTQGDLAGLLIYMPIENKNKVALNGASDSKIRGTILAPGAHVIINGNASSYGFHSQIIAYTIDATGNDLVNIIYKDEDNYDALAYPEVQLSQ